MALRLFFARKATPPDVVQCENVTEARRRHASSAVTDYTKKLALPFSACILHTSHGQRASRAQHLSTSAPSAPRIEGRDGTDVILTIRPLSATLGATECAGVVTRLQDADRTGAGADR